YPEPVGLRLDVVQQRQGGLFEQLPGVAGGEGRGDPLQDRPDLPVDHHGVQALLAAEVLVHHRFGDLRPGGDLLDRGRVEATFGDELPADADELFASLGGGHPYPGRLGWFAFGHRDSLAVIRSGRGHRTSRTQPNFSKIQMVRAEMSTWPRSTPCRAQV